METITDLTSLKKQIAYLEQKQETEKQAIADEVSGFIENLTPLNLLKSFFRSVKESPNVKSDILHGILGLGTGFLTNKLLLGKIHGPVKAILGMLLQAGITNAAVKYPEMIKNKGIGFLAKILNSIKIKSGEAEKEPTHTSAVL